MALNGRLFEITRRIGAAFDGVAIDYAIGGALALGVWGEPRGTKDIDVAVYAAEEELDQVFDILQRLDAEVERSTCRWQLKHWGHFEVDIEGIRVDVFIPDFALYDWAHPRRRRIESGDSHLWFWSAEDVLLFKLLFFRDKDKVDMKTLLHVQQANLDLDYIRRALQEIFRDDERTAWFEQTVRDVLER